ncbi:DUF4440 domain-containing protein [Erythrobacter crassostreae]|uniref:DUF4440 domain-containing protein n=1 Tax=Erythrobacter crassostreae TaxID=2828328 RepID=A0A9X1F4W6_9SPHN|nr:DUF4440 domain-containing protein [Erythrobacter crassostrea]MBV7258860.1 DUF4440 domain-containing protein [Erythrobacter crassostrea]
MLSALALALAQAAAPTPIPAIEEARTSVIANDSALFWAAFEGCAPDKLKPLLTEDFRMLHDLGGEVAGDRAAFIGMLSEQCADREPGGKNEGYKNRRLSVPASREVTPLGKWGVLERGMHTFHELRQRPAGTYGADDPGGPTWVQVGGARYIHTWKWMAEEGRFRLQQSLSIDHGSAEEYPPKSG